MTSYWGTNLSRRTLLHRGGQLAAAAGAASFVGHSSVFAPAARAEIVAKAAAF